jgi:N-acetylglutamate synthase-like GNAT family acetyltransferase
MIATPKKIRRRRAPGDVGIEQTHDPAIVAAMLDRTGTTFATDFADGDWCFLMAYRGEEPVGIAGLETEVDAALMRLLFVLETMRRRGIGASLVRAVRVAAHTRGAQTLYASAPATLVDYFERFGFAEAGFAELVQAFGQASLLPRTGSHDVPNCRALRLDISRDGLIER